MWSHIQCQKSQIPLSTLSVIVSCLSETTSVSYHINDYHINEGSALSNCACEQWLEKLNGIQPSWFWLFLPLIVLCENIEWVEFKFKIIKWNLFLHLNYGFYIFIKCCSPPVQSHVLLTAFPVITHYM